MSRAVILENVSGIQDRAVKKDLFCHRRVEKLIIIYSGLFPVFVLQIVSVLDHFHLKAQKQIDVDKKKLELPETVKFQGKYKCIARIYPRVTAEFTVSVLPE